MPGFVYSLKVKEPFTRELNTLTSVLHAATTSRALSLAWFASLRFPSFLARPGNLWVTGGLRAWSE